jgi:hypothetical protein
VTERGRGGNAEHRKPNLFLLTFAHGRESRASPPSHDWRRIETIEQAEQIAAAARANKNPDAVRYGLRRANKTKNRSRGNQDRCRPRKPGPKSPNPRSWIPGLQGQARKPGPLSISWGGGGGKGGRL